MDKKGQIGIGVIVTLAIAVIVGLILFQSIAANIEQTTQTNTGATDVRNVSVAAGAVNSVSELAGQELISSLGVANTTDVTDIVAPANYTIYECVKTSNNLKGICIKRLGSDATAPLSVSYTYYPDGYIDDAGGRSIAGIIILLTAIGIFVIVLAGSKFDF